MLAATIVRTTFSRRSYWLTIPVLGCAILTLFLFGRVSFLTEPSKPKEVSDMPIGFGGKPADNMIHPISLAIAYRDKEEIGAVEGGGEAHEGTATYVFKNNLPVPVKLVFPPLGYTAGGVMPLAPHCSDATQMPEFCRTAQIIEFAPFAERQFTSGYVTISARGAAPPTARFVFGPASDRDMKHVVVDYVESVGQYVDK